MSLHIDRRQGNTGMWLSRTAIVVCALVASMTSLLVAAVTVLYVGDEVNEKLRISTVNTCDGANMLRGYALLMTAEGEPRNPEPGGLAHALLKIRDCEKTFKEDRIVFVDDTAERRFLAELAAGHRVAIRDGGRRIVPVP